MKIRKIIHIVLIILGATFTIIGIPIIINECYKANSGYTTVWNGADVLGYYGSILGSVIAISTLAITIVFTKKQIQRDNFIKNETEKWAKVEGVFATVLDDINPIRVMKDTMDNGLTDPEKATYILQKYQLTCEMAGDQLTVCLSAKDYPFVKPFVDSIINATKQFVAISQKQIDQYLNLLSLNQRKLAEQAIKIHNQNPDTFSQKDIRKHLETIERTKDIKFDTIKMELCSLINETVSINQSIYKPLLQAKNELFESINTDIQKRADKILHIGRK